MEEQSTSKTPLLSETSIEQEQQPPLRDVSPRVDTRPTPHLPPPDSTPGTPARRLRDGDDDSDRRVIRINIEIAVPRSLIPKDLTPLGFFKFFVVVLYVSFISCAIAALAIHCHAYTGATLPILIIAVLTPILDFLGNVWAVLLMKSEKEYDSKKPSFRHAFVLLINFFLLILHFVILIFASVWTSHRIYGCCWHSYTDKYHVIGLTMYPSIAMIIIKLILAFIVFTRPEAFKKLASQTRRRWNSNNGYVYEELGQDVDEDAQIRPGTYVRHSEEETPRNSAEDGRIVLL